jgi:hypothetical protein
MCLSGGARQKEDEAAEREEDDESERDKKKLRKIEETYEDNMVCGICTHAPPRTTPGAFQRA